MKTIFVKDLEAGMTLTQVPFAINEKKQQQDKNGAALLDLTLADKSGTIRAKVFPDVLEKVDQKKLVVGKVIAFTGVVTEFKQQIQITVHSIDTVDETKLEEYTSSSPFSAEDMWEKLVDTTSNKIQNHYLRTMFASMWDNTEIVRKFKFWPAGLSFHHNFRSGLLQHVLEGLKIAEGLDEFYPDLDMDVVRAGIILHDMGKLDELNADSLVPYYEIEGSVLGHVYLGTKYVDKYLPEDAPRKLALHLKHIILSHHGKKEYGAPVLPATPEALLVYSVDYASTQVNMGMKAMTDPSNEVGMTDYNRFLERWMWAKRGE